MQEFLRSVGIALDSSGAVIKQAQVSAETDDGGGDDSGQGRA